MRADGQDTLWTICLLHFKTGLLRSMAFLRFEDPFTKVTVTVASSAIASTDRRGLNPRTQREMDSYLMSSAQLQSNFRNR